ncbi:MAG: hypothetical protein ACK4N5_06460 [Myxococcales bacterium]
MSVSPLPLFGRLAAFAVALALCLVGAPARADENGFKIGEGRLHPFFALESRFDSAAAVVPKNQSVPNSSFEIAGDMLLRFKPGLRFELPGNNLQLNLAGNLDYVQYAGVINPSTRVASRMQGEADLDIGINRSGVISLDIGDHFVRSDRTVNTVLGVGALSLFNDARAQVNIRPSGGALSFEPNYHLATEFFSPFSAVRPAGCASNNPQCDPTAVSRLNYMNHRFGLNARWKFLPKTALVLDSSLGYRTYIAGGQGVPLLGMKAMAGLAGLLTQHISTTLKLGWGQDFTNNSYKSLIGTAEVAYLFSQTGQIRGGYVRTFEPVGGNFISYGDDRGYLDARFFLGGRVTLRGYAAYDFLSFRGASNTGSAHNITGDVGGDYQFFPWLTTGVGYLFTNRSSADGQSFLNLANFQRHEIYARVHLVY